MFIDCYPPKITRCSICKGTLSCQWKAFVKKYICDQCLLKRGHTIPNQSTKGIKQKHLPTFSIEFEIEQPFQEDRQHLEQALELLSHGFIRTTDGTVSDEYKSPLYFSLQAIQTTLNVMDDLRHLVGDSCGTHLHVECHVKKELKLCMGEVFGPLVGYILDHPQESLCFWGRGFNQYASALPNGRYFLFNTQSSHPTLEYRLPRFRNKEQYLAVIKFARLCTALLDKKVPLAREHPFTLGTLGQEIVELYTSFIARQHQSSWFDGMPQEQQKGLLLTIENTGWRKRV